MLVGEDSMTMFPGFPGDDRRSARGRAPELIAAEMRILTFADALVTWMRETPWPPAHGEKLDGFMTHKMNRNPGLDPITEENWYNGTTSYMTLEKLDPDANRLFMDLLRAAWERRCWQVHWGERKDVFDEDGSRP